MTCHQCKRLIDRASGQVRSVMVDGYEVMVRVRKMTPGNASLCDDCVDQLVVRAVEQASLRQIERATKAQERVSRL